MSGADTMSIDGTWMRLTICRRIGYSAFVASGGVCFCRITPPVATPNIHPIANAVSEWDANEKFKMWNGIAISERRYDNDVLYSNCDCGHY